MLENVLNNRGSIAYATVPASIGYVASRIAIHVSPSIALR